MLAVPETLEKTLNFYKPAFLMCKTGVIVLVFICCEMKCNNVLKGVSTLSAYKRCLININNDDNYYLEMMPLTTPDKLRGFRLIWVTGWGRLPFLLFSCNYLLL